MFLSLLLVACNQPEETAFEGPGYDADLGPTVAQDTYILALTELHVKNAPGPGGLFGDHASAVGGYLYDPANEVPGFVGGSFRNIGQLNWWTMTVWTDEESMLDFVVSEPHASAMADLTNVARSARSTDLEIRADQLPMTWDVALPMLDDVPWIVQ